MDFKPWPYQQHAEQWVLEHNYCGLFLEVGLGKTVITLSAIKRLLESHQIHKVLVVAPLRVAMTVWAEEAAKWDHTQSLRCSKVLGSEDERIAALKVPADIYIINRENVAWLVSWWETNRGLTWPFDMLVLDELSSFKSHKSERFRALRRVRPACRRVVGLTGTPAPNGLIDLWSQVYLLDRGERLGRTITAYRDQYFTAGASNGYVVYNWKPKPGADREIYDRIGDLCMSMTAEDYLEMPARIDIDVPIVLSEHTLNVYQQLERDLVLPYAEDKVITAANAAVLTGKLLQMANGAIYTGEERKYQRLHSEKVYALDDIVEAAGDNSVLVYYSFRHDLDAIMAAFPQAQQLQTADDVDRWNSGQIKMLLAHPDSAGHGLNLQRGGHIIVWYGLPWSLEKYQQACGRLYRQGQKLPVTIYHLVAAGTIDEEVRKVLTGKTQRQDALINAVKARIERYDSERIL